MRLTTAVGWRRNAVLGCVLVFISAVLFALWAHADTSSSPPTARFVAATAGEKGQPRFRPETRSDLGRFALGKERHVTVSTAKTFDGRDCLMEGDEQGETSSCLEGGLFSSRKAELVVSSMGGPEQFDELYVAGVVAPGVRSARLVKTDGRETDLQLNAHGAFVYESASQDLTSRVYPTALRLFGPNGRLVATVDFPAAG